MGAEEAETDFRLFHSFTESVSDFWVPTFLGSALVLLPLCFRLRCCPKKLPDTQQQLRDKEVMNVT